MDVLEAHAQSLAKRLAQALEGREAEEQATPPSLEDALLEGSDAPPPRGALLGAPAELSSAAEAQQLRADLAEVLKQRSQLRAKLIAEQERRQHAEAELVALGAQWHGTDTARALQRRAEEEAQRKLDAQVAKVARSYEQRLAQLQAEKTLLRKKVSAGAGVALTDSQLQAELRAALRTELEVARAEMRGQIRDELDHAREHCLSLERKLRAAEARHTADADMLRKALRKADLLCQEQWDSGFVAGLKQAAKAFGHGENAQEDKGRTDWPTTDFSLREDSIVRRPAPRKACETAASRGESDSTGPGGGGGFHGVGGGRSASMPSSVLSGLQIRRQGASLKPAVDNAVALADQCVSAALQAAQTGDGTTGGQVRESGATPLRAAQPARDNAEPHATEKRTTREGAGQAAVIWKHHRCNHVANDVSNCLPPTSLWAEELPLHTGPAHGPASSVWPPPELETVE